MAPALRTGVLDTWTLSNKGKFSSSQSWDGGPECPTGSAVLGTVTHWAADVATLSALPQVRDVPALPSMCHQQARVVVHSPADWAPGATAVQSRCRADNWPAGGRELSSTPGARPAFVASLTFPPQSRPHSAGEAPTAVRGGREGGRMRRTPAQSPALRPRGACPAQWLSTLSPA